MPLDIVFDTFIVLKITRYHTILPFWFVSLECSKEIQQKRGDKVT